MTKNGYIKIFVKVGNSLIMELPQRIYKEDQKVVRINKKLIRVAGEETRHQDNLRLTKVNKGREELHSLVKVHSNLQNNNQVSNNVLIKDKIRNKDKVEQ